MTITKAARAIINAGFLVYMRNPDDTYLYFTDGTRIGYLQADRFGGLSMSTVHMPSTTHGTGFNVRDNLEEADLTAETLTNALDIIAPAWAFDRSKVRKWKDFTTFQQSNGFNAALKQVEYATPHKRPADPRYFVIGDYAEAGYSVLGNTGQTLAECRQMIRWQGVGGFNTQFHICKPAVERGEFQDITTLTVYPTNRGATMGGAYTELLASIWGEE